MHVGMMRWTKNLTATGILAMVVLPVSAQAQSRDEQDRARRDLAAGHVRSLRDIESRVLPTKPGMQYLGPEYDSTAMAYRLKFIRDGRVVFVDVDARTGRILGESR